MTTEIPCCGNCPIPNEVRNGLSRHPTFYCDGLELPFDTIWVVGKRGCLKNPNARAYLMKGVVEELEKKREDWRTSEPPISEGIRIAISIIKGGVK
jgi:hypothetical protein